MTHPPDKRVDIVAEANTEEIKRQLEAIQGAMV